jgi:hypothetical protein
VLLAGGTKCGLEGRRSDGVKRPLHGQILRHGPGRRFLGRGREPRSDWRGRTRPRDLGPGRDRARRQFLIEHRGELIGARPRKRLAALNLRRVGRR